MFAAAEQSGVQEVCRGGPEVREEAPVRRTGGGRTTAARVVDPEVLPESGPERSGPLP